MRNTTTTVVIAAGVVLAAVIVTRTPAQQETGFDGACCLPGGGCRNLTPENCAPLGGTYLGDMTTCTTATCPLPPTVVGVSVIEPTGAPGGHYRVFRSWSDGQTDMTYVRFGDGGFPGFCNLLDSCGPSVLITGTCTTDINRDGDTGIQDFLTLLGGWGACQ